MFKSLRWEWSFCMRNCSFHLLCYCDCCGHLRYPCTCMPPLLPSTAVWGRGAAQVLGECSLLWSVFCHHTSRTGNVLHISKNQNEKPQTYCFQEGLILWGWGTRCLLELSSRTWMAYVNLTTGAEWLPLWWEQADVDWQGEYWNIGLTGWVAFKIFTAYRVLTDTELWKLLFKQIEYSL